VIRWLAGGVKNNLATAVLECQGKVEMSYSQQSRNVLF